MHVEIIKIGIYLETMDSFPATKFFYFLHEQSSYALLLHFIGYSQAMNYYIRLFT